MIDDSRTTVKEGSGKDERFPVSARGFNRKERKVRREVTLREDDQDRAIHTIAKANSKET